MVDKVQLFINISIYFSKTGPLSGCEGLNSANSFNIKSDTLAWCGSVLRLYISLRVIFSRAEILALLLLAESDLLAFYSLRNYTISKLLSA